jgi:hypothetical protein
MNIKRFSIMKAPIALFLAVVMASFPSVSYASIGGARGNANVLFRALRANGWNVRDCFDVGLLRKGQSVVIRTTLLAGNTYKIAAAGCEDGYDVDISVYDQNGNFIDSDGDSQQLAVADVRPAWSGTYFIKVTMYNSTYNGAHYVVQYAFR